MGSRLTSRALVMPMIHFWQKTQLANGVFTFIIMNFFVVENVDNANPRVEDPIEPG